MSRGFITLHPEFGLNPTIPRCFFCGQDKNEIVLVGAASREQMPPTGVCFDKRPCDKCAECMKHGVILISARKAATKDDEADPYRTGGWVVMADEGVRRVFGHLYGPGQADRMLVSRVAFVEDAVWDGIGLPRGAAPGVPGSVDEFLAAKNQPPPAPQEDQRVDE